ncbi:CopG family ribbon-helix-helix protein [Halosolutus amylolyticus]|uniref:CopG family ribbon-helix-helix protein n=1 Tax=Halosolutus amylolyticus TaxID=2932267 RepID=A0ABD5PN36_9EURY|nr:CopG family ribbon-helix-helix protein [Halosolutus amylolyticus]
MTVISVSMPDSLITELDTFIEEHGYSGRSEAIREGVRGLLREFDQQTLEGQHVICVITTTFDHDSGAEAELSELRHANQDLVTSNVHSHAGNSCLDLFVVEGTVDDIGSYVACLRAIDGVGTVEHSILSADQSKVA